MEQTLRKNLRPTQERLTLRVEDIAVALDIGRSAAYQLTNKALSTGCPFTAFKVGNSLRIPRKSFDKFLEENGL